MNLSSIVELVLGVTLLVLGRKLFWLMVAVAGFAVGWILAPQFFPDGQEHVPLIAGIVLGLLGALAGVFAQKVAVLLGGFLAGGYVLMLLSRGALAIPEWIPFVAGGILGALFMKWMFEWTLILLTSLLGALLIVSGLGVETEWHVWSVAILSVVGVVIQAKMKGKKKG